MEHRYERRKAIAFSVDLFLDGRPLGRCSGHDISYTGMGIERPSTRLSPNTIVHLLMYSGPRDSGPRRFPIRAFITRVSRTMGFMLLDYDLDYAAFLMEELAVGESDGFARIWAAEGRAGHGPTDER